LQKYTATEIAGLFTTTLNNSAPSIAIFAMTCICISIQQRHILQTLLFLTGH